MVVGDDHAARGEVRIVAHVGEAQCRAHGDVGVDRHRHPLRQGARVEDALELEAELVLTAAEVDDDVAPVVAPQVVATDGVAEMVPELGLDRAEQHEPPVLGLVALVLRRSARASAGAPTRS